MNDLDFRFEKEFEYLAKLSQFEGLEFNSSHRRVGKKASVSKVYRMDNKTHNVFSKYENGKLVSYDKLRRINREFLREFFSLLFQKEKIDFPEMEERDFIIKELDYFNEVAGVLTPDYKLQLNSIIEYLNENPQFITEEVPKLTIKVIALVCIYNHTHVNKNNCKKIVSKYGHKSGHKLYQEYNFLSRKENRLPEFESRTIISNRIKWIMKALEHLSEDQKVKAKEDLEILRSYL